MKTNHGKTSKEDRNAKVEAAKAALTEGLKALVTGADWQGVLDGMARRSKFSPARFSFRNQILVQMQDPGATYVATFQAWKRVNRFVKKGEKGLYVLQPQPYKRTEKNSKTGEEVERNGIFFRILYVFALDQTEGAEFDTGDSICTDVTGEAPVADIIGYAAREKPTGAVRQKSTTRDAAKSVLTSSGGSGDDLNRRDPKSVGARQHAIGKSPAKSSTK